MLGLLGTLDLGTRSLQVEQQGTEVTGQNLANINNPAYTRQRVVIQTSPSILTPIGPEGTGADVVSIQQMRDTMVDSQIQSETSVTGYWNAQQSALESAQAALGQAITTGATGTSGASAANSADTSGALAGDLNNLFNAFQSLSTSPTSLSERQNVVAQAQSLTTQFHQVDQGLDNLDTQLNDSLNSDLGQANQLLGDIANLNQQIVNTEANSGGTANDLRDLRQQKIESLAQIVNLDTSQQSNGAVDISIDGNTLVSGKQVLDTLQTYDAGGGQMLVETASGGAPVNLTGGSVAGTIAARDGAVATLQSNLNTLASTLISQVNTAHAAGYNLNGTAGNAFFTGTNAADIEVNSAVANDPSLIQASGTAGVTGDNQAALALAQLASQKQSALNNQTFSDAYSLSVGALGNSLATANSQVTDQQTIQNALVQQRNSVSGVSLNEEMTNLVQYQRAFEASAKLVNTLSTMLDEVINMKQ